MRKFLAVMLSILILHSSFLVSYQEAEAVAPIVLAPEAAAYVAGALIAAGVVFTNKDAIGLAVADFWNSASADVKAGFNFLVAHNHKVITLTGDMWTSVYDWAASIYNGSKVHMYNGDYFHVIGSGETIYGSNVHAYGLIGEYEPAFAEVYVDVSQLFRKDDKAVKLDCHGSNDLYIFCRRYIVDDMTGWKIVVSDELYGVGDNVLGEYDIGLCAQPNVNELYIRQFPEGNTLVMLDGVVIYDGNDSGGVSRLNFLEARCGTLGGGLPFSYGVRKWEYDGDGVSIAPGIPISGVQVPEMDLPREREAVQVGVPFDPTDDFLHLLTQLINQTIGDLDIDTADPDIVHDIENAMEDGGSGEVTDPSIPGEVTGVLGGILTGVQALPGRFIGSLEGAFTRWFVPTIPVSSRAEVLRDKWNQKMVGFTPDLDWRHEFVDSTVPPVWKIDLSSYGAGEVVLIDWANYDSLFSRIKSCCRLILLCLTGIWVVRSVKPQPTID